MRKNLYFLFAFISAIVAFSQSRAQTLSTTSFVGDTTCGVTNVSIVVTGCTSGLTVKTWYGDGTNSTHPITCSGSTGYAMFSHSYAASGTYTVKNVLYSGSMPIDSITLIHVFHYCSNMPIGSYIDMNMNCVYDAGDNNVYYSGLLRVDSAGYPIDTISIYNGVTYPGYGPPGTIYAFRVLSAPPALTATCPASGIIYDTIPYSTLDTIPTRRFGYQCSSVSGFDLSIAASFTPALAGSGANKASFSVFNANCTATTATVKFEFSPKYTFGTIYPATTSYTVSGTSVTFDAGTVSAYVPKNFQIKLTPVTALTVGDTVNTKFTVSPISGDTNPSNNIVVRCDTVRGSYDPNHKSVTPTGYITGGTELEYMLEFENDGTDTAYNIHILDTLSNHLDINTFKGGLSSHSVHFIKLHNGSSNILKFDFPDIMLPDTTHHPVEQCRGMVTFSIKAKSPLAPGTTIANRVGIYFDTNPAVMTNTVYSAVPFPTGLQNNKVMQVELYPNPVNNKFTLKTDGNEYKATLYNITGQVISTYNIMKTETSISTEQLTPGIYYVVLKGTTGSKAIKFEKQ